MPDRNLAQDPNALFLKYTTAATAKIVLQNCTLRWSTPGTLNDPFDAQFDLHVDVEAEELKTVALKRIWEAYSGEEPAKIGNLLGVVLNLLREHVPGMSRDDFERELADAIAEGIERGTRAIPQLQSELRSLVAQTKLLCLTKGIDPESTLMWAHYADAHRGVTLRFRSPPELDSPYRMARPVEYRSEMPHLVDAEFLADMMSGRVRMDARTVLDRLIYTKSKEWEYENEWRISSGSGRNPEAEHEDVPFHPLELDAVILGCRMPEPQRHEIREITRARFPHAYVLQVIKADRDFRFEIAFVKC